MGRGENPFLVTPTHCCLGKSLQQIDGFFSKRAPVSWFTFSDRAGVTSQHCDADRSCLEESYLAQRAKETW
ncbi:hypothetical protein FA13DRAFT_1728132 [Coprinellus micaceus]|uniref:Uncharacterized protein n=1 Tax=Coprinellus micaceus TaxID=71717 RepID=A0A4Y7TM99_COPMI|nr:hypothetical protein FA13DRAFT_1728132 [Coprinellus micaceus]